MLRSITTPRFVRFKRCVITGPRGGRTRGWKATEGRLIWGETTGSRHELAGAIQVSNPRVTFAFPELN